MRRKAAENDRTSSDLAVLRVFSSLSEISGGSFRCQSTRQVLFALPATRRENEDEQPLIAPMRRKAAETDRTSSDVPPFSAYSARSAKSAAVVFVASQRGESFCPPPRRGERMKMNRR